MSWNPREIAAKRDAVLALSPQQRSSLTWEQARDYVPMDTMCLATWQGENRRRTNTPFQAVCRVHSISPEELTTSDNNTAPA